MKGKKIVKIHLSEDGCSVKSYDEFVTYIGDGPAVHAAYLLGQEDSISQICMVKRKVLRSLAGIFIELNP